MYILPVTKSFSLLECIDARSEVGPKDSHIVLAVVQLAFCNTSL